MLNNLVIMGRFVRDPELRHTNSGKAVASFTLAVDRDFADKESGERGTDFIDCVAWGSSAEFVSKYFGKGRMAVASGRLQIRNWTDKDGNKRKSAELIANSVYFADSKKSSGGVADTADTAVDGIPASAATVADPATDFPVLNDDEKLPF